MRLIKCREKKKTWTENITNLNGSAYIDKTERGL